MTYTLKHLPLVKPGCHGVEITDSLGSRCPPEVTEMTRVACSRQLKFCDWWCFANRVVASCSARQVDGIAGSSGWVLLGMLGAASIVCSVVERIECVPLSMEATVLSEKFLLQWV